MAITSEQKAKIQTLIKSKQSSGIPLQQAIKDSFDEVAGKGSLDKQIAEKQTAGATASAVGSGFSPYRNPAAEMGKQPTTEEIEQKGKDLKLNKDLISEESSFISGRSKELKKLGFSDIDAETQAKNEFNSMFGRTPESGFGDYEERALDKIPLVEQALPSFVLGGKGRPSFSEALSPQVYGGETEKSMDPTRRMQTDMLSAGAGIDWIKIKQNIKKASPDISTEDLDNQIRLMKAVYDKNLQIELDKIRGASVGPLSEYSGKQKSSLQLSEEVYDKTIQDMQNFAKVTEDKALKDKASVRTVAGDDIDVAAAAFGKQENLGEGVPDYNPGQMEMFKGIQKQLKEQEKKERLGKETKFVYQLGDKTLSEEEYRLASANTREDSGPSQYKKVQVLKTEADLDAELDKKYNENAWFANEETKAKYLANPERYKTEGIVTDTTIYGGQKETTAGWLMRGALSPLNAFAGFVAPLIFEGAPGSEVKAEIAQRKRERRPELYKDNPVLYNIAQNRGFFGEGLEVADILDLGEQEGDYLDKALRYGYLGGTFAADLLDPSLDLLTAGAKGIKVGRQTAAASKTIGALAGDTSALASGARAAANDFLDKSFLSAVLSNERKAKIAASGASDMRVVATSSLTRSLEDSQKVTDAIKANPDISASDVIEILKTSKSGYAKEFAKKAGTAPRYADEVAAELKAAMGADNLLQKADDIIKGLDEIVATGSSRLIRSKEVARQLGALAATDPTVAAAFKAVDAQKVTNIPKLSQYLRELEPDELLRLRKGLLYDAASTAVYKATKESSSFDNLVAVTKNTFVDKSIVSDIMTRVSDSEIGKIAKELESAKIKFVKSSKGLSQAFELTDELVVKLESIADQLQSFKKLDSNSLREIKINLKNKVITTEDFRSLIDANVDLIAESVATGGTAKIARARDVARLPVSKQLDLLVPLESRAFSREIYKQIWNRLTGTFTKNRSKLSIGQQRLFEEALAKSSNLDVTLRTKMQDLVGSFVGKLNDSVIEARQAYGITDPNKVLTKQEALAHIIVGPFQNQEGIKSTLSFALDNLFYNKTSRQNIFDLFSGINLSRNTSTLSENGKSFFDALIENSAKRIAAAPDTLWNELVDLQNQYRTLLSAAKDGDEGAKQIFSGSLDEIVDIGSDASKTKSARASKLSRKITGKVKLPIGATEKAIPQEISVAMFYKAEADRIERKMLQDLANKEIGKGNVSLRESLDEKYYNFVNSVLNKYGVKLENFESSFITNRIKTILSNPNYKNEALTRSDLEEIIGATGRQAYSKDSQLRQVVNNLSEMAEDVALSIIRQNDLKPQVSLDNIEKEIKAMTSGTGKEADNLKLLFGEDVAKQIQENLSKGFDSLKESLQTSLVRNYEQGQGSIVGLQNFIIDTFNYINDLRYTLLLTAAPRFHGGNLITGSDMVYRTTGKLPNMLDVATGLGLTHMSRYKPDLVLLKEGFGKFGKVGRTTASPKTYTAREIYDLLSTQGGKSSYSISTPNIDTKRILELTDDDYTRFNEFINSVKNTPQMEDMSYRYAVFADAIRSGRTEDEALALARKSMYDASDLSSVEKSAQRFLLFYGWARNNFVDLVKNLSDPSKGWKRISQYLKAERNVQDSLVSPEEVRWAPKYLETKIILDKKKYKGKDIYLTSPPIPLKDGFKVLGELMKGNVFDILQGFANPSVKLGFGIEPEINKLPTKISPEHVYYMGLLGNAGFNASKQELSSLLAGSEVLPRKALPEEGAVNGYIYPLTTPEQQKHYKFIVDSFNFVGASRILQDFSRSMSGEGTAVGLQQLAAVDETELLGDKLAYIFNLQTPSVGLSKEKQEYFNKLGKLQAIKKATSGMEKEDIKEEVIPVIPLTEAQKAEAAQIVRAGTRPERRTIRREDMSDNDLRNELKRLRAEKEGGKEVLREKYKGNRELYNKEFLEPIRVEIAAIQSELLRRQNLK